MSTEEGPVKFGTPSDDLPSQKIVAPQYGLGRPREHRFSGAERAAFATTRFLERLVATSLRYYGDRHLPAHHIKYIGQRLIESAAAMETEGASHV